MSQSTEKSLGRIAHETGERVGRWSRRWADMGPAQQDEWEQIAQAVAAVVREQVEDRLLDLVHGYRKTGDHRSMDVLESAIRSIKQ